MSEQKKGASQTTPGAQNHGQGGAKKSNAPTGGGATVIQLNGGCLADGCKQKSIKASFCAEHFDWFKEGLITKEGRKPTDFDKKFYAYQNRKTKKAA